LTDARARTPKPVPERRDLRGVSLTPLDGFILSRVDGMLDERDIVSMTGIPEEQVRASLSKLEALGLVAFDGVRPPAPTAAAVAPGGVATPSSSGLHPLATSTNAPNAPAPAPSPPPPTAPAATTTATAAARPSEPDPPWTPEERAALAEDVDLDAETRGLVLVTYRAVESADHYALLRVERNADRKAIKRSYFDLAAKFHPDRYFRKKLGSFKLRMEAIFGRVTQAHDALTDKTKRAEYDAYLEEQRRSRGIEELLEDALVEAKRAAERIEREASEVVAAAASPVAGTPAPATPGAVRPPAQVVAGPPVEASARRDALARRLLGGRGHAMSGAPPTAPAAARPPAAARAPAGATPPAAPGGAGAAGPARPAPTSAADAMGALRRRYEERVTQAKSAQARKYIASGEEALAKGDAVSAANAFRVAMTLAPEDPVLARSAQEAQARADAILSETYARQAVYEEKNNQWTEAARSWLRVTRARPGDAPSHERAANALVKASGDLHEAARVAKAACTLEPSNAPFRVTLANVYLAAGLLLNARRELETAAQLAPHDGTIQAMLRRMGKS
jgi:curved DNA-binding protein CbpA